MHNAPASRFEIHESGDTAVCEYHRVGDTLDLHHTFVPPALRGGGVAGRLAQEALEYARAERLRVIPSCSYIETYIRRHPEYAALLAPRG